MKKGVARKKRTRSQLILGERTILKGEGVRGRRGQRKISLLRDRHRGQRERASVG